MSIIKNLKKALNKKDKDDEKEIVKQLEESYQRKKENGEEHPIDSTIAQIMEIINNSQNPDETAKKILIGLIDTNKMPDRVPEKLSIALTKTENVSDEVVAKAVQQSQKEVPDGMIDTILEEGDFTYQVDRLTLIKNVEDEEILQKRLKDEFLSLNRDCKNKRDDEIVDRIEELKNIVRQNDVDINLKELVEKAIAIKMAENIYNDAMKGTKIYTLSKAYPVDKMFKNDIVSKVELEFRKIEKERGEKKGRFEKDTLRKQILKEIAKEVGAKYRIDDTAFNVPQSENMRNISNEEEKIFINAVQASYNDSLNEEKIKDLKEGIRGIIRKKATKESMILDKIKNMPNEEKTIDTMIDILDDENKIETLSIIYNSGLLDTLNKLPVGTRKATIETINTTVNNKVIKKHIDKEELNTEKKIQEEEIEK